MFGSHLAKCIAVCTSVNIILIYSMISYSVAYVLRYLHNIHFYENCFGHLIKLAIISLY